MTAPAESTNLDSSLLAALKLIAEQPEVLAAAMALAGAQTAGAPKRTIGQLWVEWEPTAKKLASWRICKTHRGTFEKTEVSCDSGRKTTVWDLPWEEVTPHLADLYRQTRSATPSGRRGRDGKIGNVSDSTINRELITLQSMLSYHRSVRQSIRYNPLAGFRRTNEAGFARQTYLTPEQAQRFIGAGPPMWQDITTVAYRCAGMRHSEARLLKKSEIDFEARVICLPSRRNKNRRARTIPFPSDVEAILKHHCEISRGPYVFVSTKDPKRMDPVGPSAMQYWMERARERSGVVGFEGETIVIHHLRHAGVTQLLQEGAPESMVKAAAGMSAETLSRYVKFQRPQQEILRQHMNRSEAGEAAPPRIDRVPQGRPSLVALPGGNRRPSPSKPEGDR
jgi:integrase